MLSPTHQIRNAKAALVAASLAVGLVACSNQPSDDGVIEFSWGRAQGSYLAFYVAEERGYFADEGLDPNMQVFQTGAPMIAGLESESLDIVTTGLASVFALGQGIDLRYITLEGDASAAEGFVTAPDSSITSIADLESGVPVGVTTGTCSQISAYHAAQSVGMDYSDLNAVDITPNLFGNAFASESIAGGFSWSPYLYQLEAEDGTLLGHDADWVPGGGTCPEMHAGRTEFLEQHPDVPGKMLTALERAWDDLRKEPELGTQMLMTHLSVPEDVAAKTAAAYIDVQPTFADMLDPSNRYAMVGDAGIVNQLKIASETFTELGVIDAPLSDEQLDEAVDSQYLEAFVQEGTP